MNRFLVLLFLLALVLGMVAAKGAKKQNNGRNREAGKRGGKGNSEPAATGGVWSECVPKKGDCGRGVKTCTGEECPSETAECRVRCSNNADTPTETSVDGGLPPDGAAVDSEMTTDAPKRRGGRGRGKGDKPGKPGKPEKPERTGGKNGTSTGKGRNDKGQRGGRKPNRPERPGNEGRDCKYSKATFSECNPLTNRANKTRLLKAGSPECAPMLVDSIRCDRKEIRRENRRCNYTKGEYGPCNVTSNRRVRVDALSDPSTVSEECSLTRSVEERCPAPDCKYNWEESECNAETNLVTLTGTLVNLEGAPETCETVRTKDLKCKEGKTDRCKMGEWSDYGECVDGTQSRSREIRRGGQGCKRLTVEYAAC